jgi:hypothetical protein
VKYLENGLDACASPSLTILKSTGFHCGQPTLLNGSIRSLISLRLIKRRTKAMEIVTGEHACYTLLAFFCLKMETR